jgi:multicomponent K+:H+ antiporter subunit A
VGAIVINLAFLPIVVLLAGSLLELLLGRFLSRNLKGWLAFACGLASFIAVLFMLPTTWSGTVLQSPALPIGALGAAFAYHVDGLSMVFMLMGTCIGSAILLFSIKYMEEEEKGTTRFYMLMLVFIAGLVTLVSAANLIVMYAAWEVIGLCSYFLVGFWYKQSAAVNGARKVLVITHVAGYGLLAAIILLYIKTGSFLWTDPSMTKAFSMGIAILMLVAAMGKSVMFPLHTWIPEAMNAPTPVSALLHSACYVKAGVYLVARMYSLGDWNVLLGNPMLAVGCVTMVVGVVFALAQTDLKRLLAYHTVSQLGYIITALALGTPLGVAAGLFYCVSHALFKSTLFLCAGAVQHATGTRDLKKLGGLASVMPHTSLIWLVAAASIIGVPLTNGFVAKWMLFNSALDSGNVAVVVIAWLVSLLTAFSFLKATTNAFYGTRSEWIKGREIHEVAPSMRVGMSVLAILCVVFGVAPQLLMEPVIGPAVRSLGFDWKVKMSWLGVTTGTANAGVTIGAAIAVFAFLLGLVLYRITRSTPRKTSVAFSGGEPLPIDDSVTAVDFASAAEKAFDPVYRVDPDPLYLAIWRGIRACGRFLQRIARPSLETRPLFALLVFAAAIVAVAWFL